MAEIDKNTRYQIWAALGTVLLGSGIVMSLTAKGVLLVIGWLLVLAGVGTFAALLSTERTRHNLAVAVRVPWLPPKGSQPIPPSQQGPPDIAKLRTEYVGAAAQDYWGESRYKAESDWNPSEGRAYLTLRRRDTGATTFKVTVWDPTGIPFAHQFAQADPTIVDRYPDDFRDVPMPLLKGEYTVRWSALVEDGSFPEVAESSFRIPHDESSLPQRERAEKVHEREGVTTTEWEETRRGRDVEIAAPPAEGQGEAPAPASDTVDSEEVRGEWITSPYPPVSAAVAVHRQYGDSVQLAIRRVDHVADSTSFSFVVCRVTGPNGIPFETDYSIMLTASKLLTGRPPRSVPFLYPFEDLDRPLADGPYEVEWQARSHLRNPASQVTLATDRFEIANERLAILEDDSQDQQRFNRIDEWRIEHNLGRGVTPLILDPDGSEVVAGVKHPDKDTMIIEFGRPQSGWVEITDDGITAHVGPEDSSGE